MKVAIVLHVDRHADPEVSVFADTGAALTWAAARAREFDRFGDLEEQLTDGMRRDGWLYFATYGEGASIRVEQKEVQ